MSRIKQGTTTKKPLPKGHPARARAPKRLKLTKKEKERQLALGEGEEDEEEDDDEEEEDDNNEEGVVAPLPASTTSASGLVTAPLASTKKPRNTAAFFRELFRGLNTAQRLYRCLKVCKTKSMLVALMLSLGPSVSAEGTQDEKAKIAQEEILLVNFYRTKKAPLFIDAVYESAMQQQGHYPLLEEMLRDKTMTKVSLKEAVANKKKDYAVRKGCGGHISRMRYNLQCWRGGGEEEGGAHTDLKYLTLPPIPPPPPHLSLGLSCCKHCDGWR